MEIEQTFHWLKQGQRRRNVILKMKQPMTVKQIARQAGLSSDACGVVLWELNVYRLVECLNAKARRCRVYWLTRLGRDCQAMLRQQAGHPSMRPSFPSIGCWDLYGEVCFRHRSAVIRAYRNCAEEPMQPAQIRRIACREDADLRMSANNTRDVIRWLHRNDLVRQIRPRKRSHPRYVLTDRGETFRGLLERAEERS